ncbi:hypothetical protein BDV97DRAFT_290201 [Delphinella strobiligena]|nr:hypothetical protein BDV97DRAFT_290201 [Delphinella strobiligena]
MEELQATHRKQQKDLQSRITQRKKQATKKTRKGINDECDNLERQLKEQQAAELQALTDPNGLSGTIDDLSINSSDNTSNDKQRDQQDDDHEEANPLARTPSHPIPIPIPHPNPPPDSPSPDTVLSPSTTAPKRNRARERLARRQAEQAALFASAEKESSLLPNQKDIEREKMTTEFRKRNLTEREIRADGHCLYSAVADQLHMMDIPLNAAAETGKSRIKIKKLAKKEDEREEDYRVVRRTAAAYIAGHADEFAPFLEEGVEEYVRKVAETGEWGGQLELLALARTYNVPISVLQGDGRVEDILPEHEGDAEKRIWLAYYKHGFGLGEHYNSLHKAG